MAQPVLVNIDHGQLSWDVDLNSNYDVLRTSIPVPEYANFAALPAAGANDNCLATTTDTNKVWQSDGDRWVPVDGVFAYSGTERRYTAHGGGAGVAEVFATVTIPASYLKVGDTIHARSWGAFANPISDQGAASIDWGSVSGGSVNNPGSFAAGAFSVNEAGWEVEMIVTIVELEAIGEDQNLLGRARYQVVGSSGAVTNTLSSRAATQDDSSAIDIDFVGNNLDDNNADACILHGYEVIIKRNN